MNSAADRRYKQRKAMNRMTPHFPVLLALFMLNSIGTVLAADAPAAGVRSLPVFEVDASWPKVPPKWKLGGPSSIAIDAQDNVWVLHRPRTRKPDQAATAALPVIVFDGAGNFVKAWGGAGSGYEWPEREHGIHIDYKGFVWVGGNYCPLPGDVGLKPVADDALLKFTQDGKFVMQIGHSNQSKGNADTANVHRAADTWVYQPTNELFVADGYGNHRVIVFDADNGAFKRLWGAFGNKPTDDDHCETVQPKSFPEAEGPQSFSTVHAIRIARDGKVYVADRENRRVQMFTKDGRFLKQLIRTGSRFALDLALSPDPEQQFLYVGSDQGIAIVDRNTLEALGNIRPAGVITSHHIASDSRGNIYIASPGAGMQKLVFKGVASRQP
jgi:hypothetical protein